VRLRLLYNKFMEDKYIKARELRYNSTTQEQKLWNLLRNKQFNGIKFVRQYPIGDYIVDFACRKLKLIIELDGGQHNEPQNIAYDNKRSEYLTSRGYRIIRFWNNEIDENIEGVYLKLSDIIRDL